MFTIRVQQSVTHGRNKNTTSGMDSDVVILKNYQFSPSGSIHMDEHNFLFLFSFRFLTVFTQTFVWQINRVLTWNWQDNENCYTTRTTQWPDQITKNMIQISGKHISMGNINIASSVCCACHNTGPKYLSVLVIQG